ncbi:MAG TPA: outer membrane beta-barrel protein [Candidatus Saccharimonadaceae bacterium]|nr:outer membrane beta-barrel protein [Candidatus Saccharimonadaceae bacterium]
MNFRKAAWAVALLALPAAAHADHLGVGNSMVWIGFNGNKAQLVGPTTGSINEYEDNELGGTLGLNYFVTDEWTVCASGGVDVARTQFRPASTTRSVETYSSRSWNVRVGGDRYAFINDRAAIYAGPGLLYWTGRGTYQGSNDPAVDRDWPRVVQVGFNGRLGMYASITERMALFGHIGQVLARNTATDPNGRNIWFTAHPEGSVGLSFEF